MDQSDDSGANPVDLIGSAIEREVFGKISHTYSLKKLAALDASLDSAKYYANNMASSKNMETKWQLLDFSLASCQIDGLVIEAGVYTGSTINFVASRSKQKIYGFDVFYSGLPETWRNIAPKGQFKLLELPAVAENVELIVGLFEDTLPVFAETHAGPIRLLHVDCDLYSSTRSIFRFIGHKICPGSVIVFDEYFNYPGWRQHEYRAFQEFISWSGLKYEYIANVDAGEQVAVIIT